MPWGTLTAVWKGPHIRSGATLVGATAEWRGGGITTAAGCTPLGPGPPRTPCQRRGECQGLRGPGCLRKTGANTDL